MVRALIMQTGAVPANVAAGMTDQQVKDLLFALQVGGQIPARRDDGWGRVGPYGEAGAIGCTPGVKVSLRVVDCECRSTTSRCACGHTLFVLEETRNPPHTMRVSYRIMYHNHINAWRGNAQQPTVDQHRVLPSPTGCHPASAV